MAGLDPSVAVIRAAVRRALRTATREPRLSGRQPLALVACSGGADSLALAGAALAAGPRLGWRVGLVTVDHQLQSGSAEQALAVADWARSAGFAPVSAEKVEVAAGPGGPEAAARAARYRALAGSARAYGAQLVLLGHTEDDQAETVLLALLRGAGLRGLAGMPPARIVTGVAMLRPLLAVSRRQTRQACAALGLTPWEDPHNSDPRFARARARELLGLLAERLGPVVVANLARTAALAADDAAALDALALDALAAAQCDDGGLRVDVLAALPNAVRSRVLHGWAAALGSSRAALSHRHVRALDALVVDWHGQGEVHLPGAIRVSRRRGRLRRTDQPSGRVGSDLGWG